MKKIKKMPDGGKISKYVTPNKLKSSNFLNVNEYDQTDENVVNWNREYINSSKYKKRLKNFNIDPSAVDRRTFNLDNTAIQNTDRNGTYHTPGVIYMDSNELSKWSKSGTKRDEILSHELGHITNAGGENSRLNDQERQYIYDRNMSATPGNIQGKNNLPHELDPRESMGDINALRYLLYNEGIYNAGKADMTPNILRRARKNDRIKNSNTLKRLDENFGDEDIIDIMNKVATNENSTQPTAKYGRKMKMPDGGKVNKGVPILPYGVRPNASNDLDQWNAAANNQLLTGVRNQTRPISPSEKFMDVEQGAYDRYESTPQKAYPDTGERIGKLTAGKLRGAAPSAEMVNDLIAAADKEGVPRNTMLGLAANESMFGMGYRDYEGRRKSNNASSRGILQQNVISSWDMDHEYRPVPSTTFAGQKNIPGVKLTKDKQGYRYDITDQDLYKRSLDSTLTAHPEYIDQYRNANANVKAKGDINYFDQTAKALRTDGLASSRFNPGDPDYTNKVNESSKLVQNDPVIQQFYKNYDSKTKSTMKNGGSIDMEAITAHLNGMPLAKDGIRINPANKGKFTASASKAGMSVADFANEVLRHKDKYSPTQVKRANFARNAAKWHKAEFGIDMPGYVEPYQEDPRLATAKSKITDYFQNNPSEGWVPNDATMQGADPTQNQYETNEDGDVRQTEYNPNSGDSRATANVKNIGQGMPNIHLNAGVAITALAGFATKGLKKAQEIDEFSRLKRRQLTGQTYNPNAYGTGSQAIMKMGGSISSKYQLTPEQAQFLKKQGYNI